MDTIAKIETTIRQISQLYREFTEDYYGHTEWEPINLRKLTTTQAVEDPLFLKYVADYALAVEGYNETHDLSLGNPDSMFRHRKKFPDTIERKLEAKSKAEVTNGSYYVQKVLNDIVGFRIILPNINSNHQQLLRILEQAKSEGLIFRWYVRDDHKYHAAHCYFKLPGNNRCFPWELQIWDSMDAEQNIADHSYHEQQRLQQLKN